MYHLSCETLATFGTTSGVVPKAQNAYLAENWDPKSCCANRGLRKRAHSSPFFWRFVGHRLTFLSQVPFSRKCFSIGHERHEFYATLEDPAVRPSSWLHVKVSLLTPDSKLPQLAAAKFYHQGLGVAHNFTNHLSPMSPLGELELP